MQLALYAYMHPWLGWPLADLKHFLGLFQTDIKGLETA